MDADFTSPDAAVHAAAQQQLLLQRKADGAISGSAQGGWQCRQDDVLALVIGQPVFSDNPAADNPAVALLQAYQQHGSDVTAAVHGACAYALADEAKGQLLAATDRLGRFPLYYRADQQSLIVSSTVAATGPTDNITAQAVFDYLYFHMIPAPATAWRDVAKLPAATQLESRDGHLTTARYWLPDFRRSRQPDKTAALDEVRRLVTTAVADATPTTGQTGAFLSGGLDSSSVAGALADLSAGPARAYCIGFAEEGYDETAFARITAEHFGLQLREYQVTPDDVVAALPAVAAAFDEPFGNSSALPAYFCARLAAEDGVTTLLAGDGGDEIFAGNERYAHQKAFRHYHRLPRVVREALLRPLVLGPGRFLPYGSKAASYLQQAEQPLPDRLQNYNFLHRIDPSEVFQASLLAEASQQRPLAMLRDTFNAPQAGDELDRMLYLDWQFTLADNDLRKVRTACALAGIEVRFPLLDDRLIAHANSIPSAWKLPGRQLRQFYKDAMRGWLPEATLNKSKHGFGLPFGLWMRQHQGLRQLVQECLARLAGRNLFRRDFLDHALKLHRDGHAAYYGELVWILVVLELWLQSRDGDDHA